MHRIFQRIVVTQLSVSPQMRPFGLLGLLYFGTVAFQALILRYAFNVGFQSASLFLLVATGVLAQTSVLAVVSGLARTDFGCKNLLAFQPRAFVKGLMICGPMPLLILLVGLYSPWPGLSAITSLFRSGGPRPLALIVDFFICFAILAPILEEVAMRGFLQTSFLQHYGPTASVILTALCFSLMHWEQRDPTQSLYSFFLGALFSLWRLKGKTLWAAIGGHMGFNISAFAVNILLLDLPREVLAVLGAHPVP